MAAPLKTYPVTDYVLFDLNFLLMIFFLLLTFAADTLFPILERGKWGGGGFDSDKYSV
jgi:hypothetical protein